MISIKFFSLFVLLVSSLVCRSNEIKSIDFFQEGEVSKIIVELERPVQATKRHNIDAKQLSINLPGVLANQSSARDIDTSEFSGSVVLINPVIDGDQGINLLVQLRDNVQSKMITEGNRIILNVENRFGVFTENSELAVKGSSSGASLSDSQEDLYGVNVPKSTGTGDILDNISLSGPKKYVGKRISINVKNIGVADLLNMIADTSGFNIIIDDEVSRKPPMTISLTNIPWDEALDTILSLNKLSAKKIANILTVQTLEKALKDRQDKLASEKNFKVQDPLVTKIFPISYAKLEDLQNILADYQDKERGKITKDERTNNLIVKDTVSNIDRMKKIVNLLDTATPQVLIEAKIVEALEKFRQEIGLDDSGVSFDYNFIGRPTDAETGAFTFSTASGGSATGTTFLGVTVGVFKRLENLAFNLKLLETEEKAKIVSAPKIIAQNKEEATITSSNEISVQTTTTQDNVTSVSFETLSADLSLKVTPQVTNEGSISMEIAIEKSDFQATSTVEGAPPDRNNNSIETNVLVDNGSTIVIGGLYKSRTSESHSGIPFLKDLPIIGWLFRSAYNPEKSKQELVVFLTPRIINQEQAGFVDQDALN